MGLKSESWEGSDILGIRTIQVSFTPTVILHVLKNSFKVRQSGNVQNDANIMGNMASTYFQNLFTKDDNLDAFDLVDLFPQVIVDDDNARLCL